MLQKMRDQTQSLMFRILVGIIVFVLAVFGFGAFNLFVTGDPEVASVNGTGITQNRLATETERERRRIAGQTGEDPSAIDPVRLQQRVLDQLIARALLQHEAEELGLAVDPERLNALLVNNPNFQADGRFEPALYRRALQTLGYTPQTFIDETEEMLTLDQLQSTVSQTAFLTEREFAVNARLLAQQRDLAYLPFTVDRFRSQVSVTDEDVELRYQENQLDYMTEENVDVEYVVLSAESLAEDPSVEVSEDEVRATYESEKAAAPAEQERRSRHILLETGDARTAEEAEQQLAELKARIEAGESFADLAAEVSEDPGSAAQGGDLGFAGRGVFDPAFEEALFALEEPGDVSEPVQSDFGWHLIQLEEVRDNEYPSFADARQEIEARLRRQQAEQLYLDRLREMDNLAFEQPGTLEGIVDGLGLEAEQADGVTRAAGAPPFDRPEVREVLFSSEVLEDGFNSAAVEVAPDRAVVMRVVERHAPEPIALEDVAEQIRDEIESERARDLAVEAHRAALARLEAGDSATEVAEEHGLNWQNFELARRSEAEVPRSILETAFELPRPADGGKSMGEAALPGGGLALVTVTRVRDGDVAALSEAELQGMRQFLANRAQRLELAGYFESLEDAADIERAN